MEYRRLGRTGLMVSELCLGCMTFGRGQTPFQTVSEAHSRKFSKLAALRQMPSLRRGGRLFTYDSFVCHESAQPFLRVDRDALLTLEFYPQVI